MGCLRLRVTAVILSHATSVFEAQGNRDSASHMGCCSTRLESMHEWVQECEQLLELLSRQGQANVNPSWLFWWWAHGDGGSWLRLVPCIHDRGCKYHTYTAQHYSKWVQPKVTSSSKTLYGYWFSHHSDEWVVLKASQQADRPRPLPLSPGLVYQTTFTPPTSPEERKSGNALQ